MPDDPEFTKRIHLYKAPSSAFDPLTASPRQLEELRLPARPRDDQLAALAFWIELFSAPLKFIEPKFECIHPEPLMRLEAFTVEPDDVGPGQRRSFSNPARYERSRNWSGSTLKSRRPERFTGVNAAWTVPTVSVPIVPPVNPAPGNASRDQYRSSAWVGLNGYRSYPHVTMPQIGTWQHVKLGAGQPSIDTAAWWQWWSRDEVTPIVKFQNLSVLPGHRVLAGLVVVADDEVVFYIKNQSTGEFAWVLVQAPPHGEPLGMTAEWVLERPTTPGVQWPWRMPKFSDFTFEHCHALAGQSIVGSQNVRDLERARFIRMQERFPAPYRSAYIAVPERSSASRLQIRYREG